MTVLWQCLIALGVLVQGAGFWALLRQRPDEQARAFQVGAYRLPGEPRWPRGVSAAGLLLGILAAGAVPGGFEVYVVHLCAALATLLALQFALVGVHNRRLESRRLRDDRP